MLSWVDKTAVAVSVSHMRATLASAHGYELLYFLRVNHERLDVFLRPYVTIHYYAANMILIGCEWL